MIFNVLTIAGSDTSGGAGIQADLKTFSALGVYGLTVVTALTAQNTQGVHAIQTVPPAFLKAQLDAVFQDVRIDAVKIGMLANVETIETVAEALSHYQPPYVVLDTVMVAKGGGVLLPPTAVDALSRILVPLVDLITPNLPEAAALCGGHVAENEEAMRHQGRQLLTLGCGAVLMKGGHLSGIESPDWLLTATQEERFCRPRIITHHIHGTGCTLSSTIAALRPQRLSWSMAVREAKDFLQGALQASDQLSVGQGNVGPLHHFYRWWKN